MNAAERFDAKVFVTSCGCWLWTGAVTYEGYGQFTASKQTGAHRWNYERRVGPIPVGLELDHLCRVPSCVNPAHLEPVTRRENFRRSPLHQAGRTHCPQGHAYDATNTGAYLHKSDGRLRRHCLTCQRAATARWRLGRKRRN